MAFSRDNWDTWDRTLPDPSADPYTMDYFAPELTTSSYIALPSASSFTNDEPLTYGANYNNINGAYSMGQSFSNPTGSNVNCGAVAFARAEGYANADDFQEDIMGFRPEEALKLGGAQGLSMDEMDIFSKELGRNYTTDTFFPKDGKTAYEVMRETYQPPPGTSIMSNSVIAYTRSDNSGHAVNGYHPRNGAEPIFLDHQHCNFGAPIDHEVMQARALSVFTPGEYESRDLEAAARERMEERGREGEMDAYGWFSGVSEPEGRIPSFEAFQHHVGLQSNSRYRNVPGLP